MAHLSDFINRVIRGDCREVLRGMPPASVDLVLTDPPYGAGYRDRAGRSVANDDNLVWLLPAFEEAARVLKPDCFCVSFYGWHRADKFLSAWKAAGFRPAGQIVWAKPYRSNARRRFLEYRHECAYLLAKGRPPLPQAPIPDVLPWEYSGNRRHPTEKPVSAMRRLIGAFSKPDDIVLDPFAGCGTTAVAALELGRRFVAIELAPQYCAGARAAARKGRSKPQPNPTPWVGIIRATSAASSGSACRRATTHRFSAGRPTSRMSSAITSTNTISNPSAPA